MLHQMMCSSPGFFISPEGSWLSAASSHLSDANLHAVQCLSTLRKAPDSQAFSTMVFLFLNRFYFNRSFPFKCQFLYFLQLFIQMQQ